MHIFGLFIIPRHTKCRGISKCCPCVCVRTWFPVHIMLAISASSTKFCTLVVHFKDKVEIAYRRYRWPWLILKVTEGVEGGGRGHLFLIFRVLHFPVNKMLTIRATFIKFCTLVVHYKDKVGIAYRWPPLTSRSRGGGRGVILFKYTLYFGFQWI